VIENAVSNDTCKTASEAFYVGVIVDMIFNE
jgi:hypothetical protein